MLSTAKEATYLWENCRAVGSECALEGCAGWQNVTSALLVLEISGTDEVLQATLQVLGPYLVYRTAPSWEGKYYPFLLGLSTKDRAPG